jgi:hypothetical protein
VNAHKILAGAVAAVMAAGLGSGAAMARLPEPSDQGFTDIEGSPHEDNINVLAAIGAIRGKTATQFAPNDPATRGQLASIIVRALQAEEELTFVARQNFEHDTFVLPDGTTFTGPGEEEEEEEEPPPVGSQFFAAEDLFATADGTTAGAQVGGTRIQCTFQTGTGFPLTCVGVFTVEGEGSLYGITYINYAEADPEEDFVIRGAITGGDGAFAGARGTFDLVEAEDFEESGESTYTIRLSRT